MQKQLINPEKTPEDFAFLLLAQVCRTDYETLLGAFNNFDYTPRYKKKRSGEYRKYFVPHGDLGGIQKSLLQNFFVQLDRREVFSSKENHFGGINVVRSFYFPERLHGFLKRRSYVDNAKKHTSHYTRFVLRLDLKDAFPSVTREMVESALRYIIKKDIEKYWVSWNAREQDYKIFKIIGKVLKEAGSCSEKMYDLFDTHDPKNITWRFR
jgi:hypothetical protein